MSTYSKPNVNGQPPQIADLGWFSDIRFDADDSQPTYIGLHVTNGADTASTDWKVYKFTYNSNNIVRIQLSYGAWDNRVGLF